MKKSTMTKMTVLLFTLALAVSFSGVASAAGPDDRRHNTSASYRDHNKKEYGNKDHDKKIRAGQRHDKKGFNGRDRDRKEFSKKKQSGDRKHFEGKQYSQNRSDRHWQKPSIKHNRHDRWDGRRDRR